MKKILLAFLTIIALSCSKQSSQIISAQTTDSAVASTIQFSGYTWNVKNGSHLGPGPNYWSRKNVWVDDKGFLHLKITHDSATGKWYCAEVSTQQTFGFGKWQFWVERKYQRIVF